ncbi:MAG TPA: metalloregulator ArsR/SmtB family transcription factor [Asanoa sp.]|nr:metalloregulator ArsR/SmtB family transcription factor [Asanoa sp.]
MSVTDVMKALGDPVRWDLFIRIAARPEVGGTELGEAAAVSKPTMSYHLGVLRDAGLIQIRKQGRHHFYRVHREYGARVLADARRRLKSQSS